MTAQTFEVELDHGKVRPVNGGELPVRGRAILTMVQKAKTGAEVIEDLKSMPTLSTEEAESFRRDLHEMRAKLPPLKSPWDDPRFGTDD